MCRIWCELAVAWIASVSVCFYASSKHFSLFGRAKIWAMAKHAVKSLETIAARLARKKKFAHLRQIRYKKSSCLLDCEYHLFFSLSDSHYLKTNVLHVALIVWFHLQRNQKCITKYAILESWQSVFFSKQRVWGKGFPTQINLRSRCFRRLFRTFEAFLPFRPRFLGIQIS